MEIETLPFLLMHLGVVAAFFVPFHPSLLLVCALSYWARMFFVTGGYHRYFAHRTYKTSRLGQFALGWLTCTTLQKGPLWWAAHHRHHHRFSDQPEDLHSPLQSGFWWSHVGWIVSPRYNETQYELVGDLMKYPELRWLNRWHLVPAAAYGAALFLLGGWGAFVWGFVISTVLLWHGTFTINSLSHVFGSRRYATTDTSRNNLWLALLTFGEGWHNNHHCYMSSARQGFFWWEVDITYYLLKGLSWLGLVRDLKQPPLAALEAKRLAPAGASAHQTSTVIPS